MPALGKSTSWPCHFDPAPTGPFLGGGDRGTVAPFLPVGQPSGIGKAFAGKRIPVHLPPMRTVIVPLFLVLCLHARGQDDPRLFTPTSTQAHGDRAARSAQDSTLPGKVTVRESAAITAGMAQYAAHARPLEGYRVQIFIGDRSTAEATRRSFLTQHPDIPAYLSYLAPNFRVRVGDLRDRVAAEQAKENLKAEYPGLYVVPDRIEWPRLP